MKILRRAFDRIVSNRGGDILAAAACVTFDYGDGWIEVDTRHAAYPRSSSVPSRISVPSSQQPGPGSELKALLKDWLGIEASPTCSCNAMSRKMDTNGPDWCEGEGMASILDVMRTEHAKRWADGRTILPWTDSGARQLVLLACRRARAKAAG